jgi:sulfopyruvate decarboxylase subunit alpha
MRAEDARVFVEGLIEAGFDLVASVPASEVHTLQLACEADPRMTFVGVTNEGEAAAVCAGGWLAGKIPVMMCETSGVLLAAYSLVRNNITFGIPVLVISTFRGSLGEEQWYAVHTGAALTPLLGALGIPYAVVDEISDVKRVLVEASQSMRVTLKPLSLVLGGRLTRAGEGAEVTG